ncbi:CD4-1 molecule [Astyanax mexicanus]|uniref:CD4-1 molecule n=1 Tax=Astyanax mexicanus TaxID=7994 RepID=UPI0020CB156F|nr:CD4-1 molecule [Astyanax mexicanus]
MLILWMLFLQLVLARSTTGQKIFAQVGGSATLPKGQFAETENVYVRWYFSVTGANNFTLLIWRKHKDPPKPENKDWQSRVSLSEDSSLIISHILESDFNGVFKCEQDNFRNSAEARYSLTRVQMPMNLLLLEGEELSLDCKMETPVKWTAPNGTSYINRLSGNKNILKVPNTLIQDSGVWACEASAGLRKFRAATAVTILGLSPPPSDTVYTSLSSSITLPCSLSTDVPWSQLREKGLQGGSWSFSPPNQSLQQGHQLLTLGPNQTQAWRAQSTTSCLTEREFKNRDLSAQTQKVSTDCRGTYQCSLEFRNKRPMRRTVKLEVLEALSSAPAGAPLLEGDKVSLNCSLGVPLPSDLGVKWTPPKSSAFSLPKAHGVHLFLPAVSVKDSGVWRCELMKNSVVLTSASVALKIEKLVKTWVIVTICSASIFILLLIITLIIIHRRRQVVITRRKTRFCCCKNPQPKGFYKS